MNAKKGYIDLKTKIMVSTLVPVVISLGLISSVILVSLVGSLNEAAEAKMLQISQKYAHTFQTKINNAMNYLSIVASDLELDLNSQNTAPLDRKALQAKVYSIFDDYDLIDGSSVYFEENAYDGRDADYIGTDYGTPTSGKICWYFYIDNGETAYLPEAIENDIEFELPHYAEAKRTNAPIYTDPVVYEVDGKNIPMFTLTYPVRNSDGQFVGAVTVDLFLDDIYEQLQNEKIYNTGYMFIVNDNDRIVYSPNYDDIGSLRRDAGFKYALHTSDEETLVVGTSIYIPQLDRNFYVSVVAPIVEINAEGVRLTMLLISVGIFSLISIAMVLYYVIGKIAAPLDEITGSVDKIAGGEYNARISGNYKGEFGVVKDSVNTMADSIESYIRALDQRLGQQALMSDISLSFVSDEDCDVLIANALQMIGEFMGVAQILFYKAADDGITFECESEWINPKLELDTRIGGRMVLKGALIPILDELLHNRNCVSSNDPEMKSLMAPYRVNFTNFISAPIVSKEQIYGVLDISKSSGDWSESDINMAILVSSLLSGVFDRQYMENQLRNLSSIVESASQLILYVTADGKLSYANPAAEVITGYTVSELVEGGLGTLFSPFIIQDIKENYIPKTLHEGAAEFEIELQCRDGRTRIMAFSSFKTNTAPGNVGCIASDVTEMRQLESELIAAKDLAEQGSRSKSEFLSRMSHEMRTPMNAIIGMTNIAQNSSDPAKKEYCLEQIDNASHHLLNVINDILDMSKIEANKFELDFAEFSLCEMLTSVLNVIQFRVEEKNQVLTLDISPSIPERLIGDSQRIAQVLSNLLTNAVKFTPNEGTIQLKAKVINEGPETVTLQVEVIDSGIGISKEQQTRLFRSFEQADGSIARKFGGTGLGLAITKHIVEMMSGEVWVDSDVGQGSHFYFTFIARKCTVSIADIATDEELNTGVSPVPSLAGKTAILAEDVAINREIILTVLEDTGLLIDCAENGQQAVDLFAANPGKYDIIFMDVHMPEVDGLEATQRIRSLKTPESTRIPILAMTADVFREDIDKCIEAGMNDHIGKPIDFNELYRKLSVFLN